VSCEQTRALFSELADAVLSVEAREAAQAHLAVCPDCQREWQSFRRMLALLHAMPRTRAPEGFVDRVLAAAEPARRPRRLRHRLFVPLRVKLPLEAAALVLVAVGAVYLMQGTPELQHAVRLDVQPSPPPASSPPPGPGPSPAPGVAPPTTPAPPTRADDAARRMAAERTLMPEPASKDEVAPANAPEPRRERPAAPMAPRESRQSDQEARQRLVSERAPKIALPREVPWPGARLGRAPTVSGHLAVGNREAAEQALADLLKRVGGVELRREASGDLMAVEAELAQGAWSEFVHGLGGIGAWAPDAEPGDLPQRVVVIIRLGR
jgi:hypothetical protein